MTYLITSELDGEVFESETQATFVATTPGGSTTRTVSRWEVDGIEAVIEVEVDEIWTILDDPPDHLSLEGTDMTSTRTLLGTSVTTSSEERFTPSWRLGPFTRRCGGETWVTDSVTSTLVVEGGPPVVGPTAAWDGVVEAIDERLTVTAGTFDVVRSKTTLTAGAEAGSWTRQWNSIEHGVMVRQETYDPSGRRVGSFEAIRIE